MRRQDYYEDGFLVKKGERYVESVIPNGHPEKPVIYWTENENNALAFRRYTAAEMRAMQLDAKVVSFRTEDRGLGRMPKRIITGELVV